MAINKAVKAALKTVTRLDIDVKKTYKLERKVRTFAGRRKIKRLDYQMWDQEVLAGGYSVPVRIFGSKSSNKSVLLFFHGGGWVMGNIDSYTKICADMAQKTCQTVVSVDYRLSPEYKFPVAVEECYAVAKEIIVNGILGVKGENITLIGDSAGGNLAAAVSLMARDRKEFMPKRQILIYPVTNNDHSVNSPFPSVRENGSNYLLTSKRVEEMTLLYRRSDVDLSNPYFAPLCADDFSNQPDTLIITAQFDPLRDEGIYYGKVLKEAGNYIEIYTMQDALHGFLSLPPEFLHVKRAYNKINKFLTSRR